MTAFEGPLHPYASPTQLWNLRVWGHLQCSWEKQVCWYQDWMLGAFPTARSLQTGPSPSVPSSNCNPQKHAIHNTAIKSEIRWFKYLWAGPLRLTALEIGLSFGTQSFRPRGFGPRTHSVPFLNKDTGVQASAWCDTFFVKVCHLTCLLWR